MKPYFYTLWYLGVFAGGYFLHSIASVIIFLLIPTRYAERISPAFKNWKVRDCLFAWLQLVLGFGLHFAIYWIWGTSLYLSVFGYPLIAFAWIWSILFYVYHYRTSIGREVKFNVRSTKSHWFLSWLFLNSNEHATHHIKPSLPWYRLSKDREHLPLPYEEKNQESVSFWCSVGGKLKGPTIVYRKATSSLRHLFVYWED